ncbi:MULTISPECIES: sugar phosphate isomerase/epimerase family protein [unclassified Bradyrhizobium]|uniref:sugar phosphate isomerase/epimerase family protein n=1 Tax=unclassified Bradyrhizobium TaxID=2631580 RepID=UPI00041AB070|nr:MULTISPECIES: xylose isomerase [unclassified Bradyrhizobium]QIG98311.1 sugar phosphate isomerase/epimerase [Bradyrhizobium sp. 6(2017)]
MAQQLRVLQSLWAMERRLADEGEWPLQTQLAMIRDAGFDGAGVRFIDPAFAREVTGFLRAHGMIWQAQCYPKRVDDLKPVLELVAQLGADHVNLQPDIRPRLLADCIPLLEGWRRLAAEAGVAVHVETHRDRMTTDLFFTLDLLDCFPDLRLTADLSHYLVGREFAWPVDDVNHAMIHRILDNAWGIHGRIASREQVQISLGFPQHQGWVSLFTDWWDYAIRSWRKRAGPDATLTFLCELGPSPYAITGPDGRELSDRWHDALVMKDMIRALWERIANEPQDPLPR